MTEFNVTSAPRSLPLPLTNLTAIFTFIPQGKVVDICEAPRSNSARTLMGGNYFLHGVLRDPLWGGGLIILFLKNFYVRGPLRLQTGNNKITLFPSTVTVEMMAQEGRDTKSMPGYPCALPTTRMSPHGSAQHFPHSVSFSGMTIWKPCVPLAKSNGSWESCNNDILFHYCNLFSGGIFLIICMNNVIMYSCQYNSHN